MNTLLAPQVSYDQAETEPALARPLPDCRGGRRFLHALVPISRPGSSNSEVAYRGMLGRFYGQVRRGRQTEEITPISVAADSGGYFVCRGSLSRISSDELRSGTSYQSGRTHLGAHRLDNHQLSQRNRVSRRIRIQGFRALINVRPCTHGSLSTDAHDETGSYATCAW
jgi:hypothetical protein